MSRVYALTAREDKGELTRSSLQSSLEPQPNPAEWLSAPLRRAAHHKPCRAPVPCVSRDKSAPFNLDVRRSRKRANCHDVFEFTTQTQFQTQWVSRFADAVSAARL